jgi:hypothetical protein
MINQHKINMAIDERIDRVYNQLNNRIKELTDKLNAQDDINAEILKKINKLSFNNIKTNDKQVEVNKHINNKFRKVWDCINADHLRLEAVEEVITGINDKLDCVNDKEVVLEVTPNDLDEAIKYIQTLQDRIIKKENK